MIIDERPLIRAGLRSVAEATGKAVDTFNDFFERDGLHPASCGHQCCMILDLTSDPDGKIGLAARHKENAPGSKLFVLYETLTDVQLRKLYLAGADGIISWNTDPADFIEALEKVIGGSVHYDDRIKNQIELNRVFMDNNKLTKREKEILILITEGFTNDEIGKKLRISRKTVDSHRTKMMKKINSRNLAGVIRFALENGYIR